jgi:hypothetical protein
MDGWMDGGTTWFKGWLSAVQKNIKKTTLVKKNLNFQKVKLFFEKSKNIFFDLFWQNPVNTILKHTLKLQGG